MSKSNMDKIIELFQDKDILEIKIFIEKLPMKQYMEIQTYAGKMLTILEKANE